MIDIKQMIQGEAYSFLRNEPDLKSILYLTVSGSHAYGTSNENSDIDLRGFLLEPPRYLYGLETFEQFEERTTDTVVYGLKKFVSLCVQANPNALELLGTKEECIAIITPQGRLLRENADLFLSRRVIQSFGSYASAQLRRLSNALCHDQYTLAQQEEHLASVFQGQMEHFNRAYTPLHGNMRIYPSPNPDEPVLLMDVELKGYPLRDFASIYSELASVLRTYGKMNHRNRKKDDAHLYKHAMHLIRMLMTGIDILNGKGIRTHRRAEHELLMAIRNGEYSFDEVFGLAKEYQQQFEAAAKHTALPAAPPLEKVEALLLELYGAGG